MLLMHKPRLTRVPDAFFKASLHIPVLKTKFVVYQVWNCPGFYMYLSNRCAFLVHSRPFFSLVPRIEKLNALRTSERAGDDWPACERQHPRIFKCRHPGLHLVCRGHRRRPSACLQSRRSLYPTILHEVYTETVVEEG